MKSTRTVFLKLTTEESVDVERDKLLSKTVEFLMDESFAEPPLPGGSRQALIFDIHSSFSAMFSAFKMSE